MKSIYLKLLAAALCLAMLCACGADNNAAEDGESVNTPSTENGDTMQDDTATVPDESVDEGDTSSEGENTDPVYTELTGEELAEWESYLNSWERNGLLRFPYADLENDPDQLAPYLGLLFYDIGVLESEFSDEELALLAQTDLWTELDTFRLSREFMNGYLYEQLNIPAEKTENLLDAAKLGVYLLQFDAWYICHSDCAYNPYTFKSGAMFADGSVKLCYFNDFLAVVQENGEYNYVDANMIITLAQREDGTWYVVSHEIDSSAYN